MDIPRKHRTIIKLLYDKGFESHIVGGAIRDYVTAREVKDYDIATSAKPSEIKEILEKNGYNTKLVGESFNVIMVDDIEIATFRKDRYFGLSDKNVEISYASSIEEDLERRDFTFNSVAYNPMNGQLADPFNGVHDAVNNILKFTGDPQTRIYEDPCRILRACRFMALDEDMIMDYETESALYIFSDLVDNIAPERIRLEILKAMHCQNASWFFIFLKKFGILDKILPSMANCYGLEGGFHHKETVFDHMMYTGDYLPTNKPLLKLSGYLHDAGKSISAKDVKSYHEITFYGHEVLGAEFVAKELKALKFSNEEIDYIKSLIMMHMRFSFRDSSKAVRKVVRDLKNKNIPLTDFLRLRVSDRHGNLAKEDYTEEEINNLVQKLRKTNRKGEVIQRPRDLAIDGHVIMDILNIPQGREVGIIINELMEYVLEYPTENNPIALINFLLRRN